MAMFKVENFGVSWIDFVLPFPCEVHHCQPRAQTTPGRFAVLTHYTEPRQLKWPLEAVRQFAGAFHLILTNEESLLDLPNAQFALFGGAWAKEAPVAKRFELSFLYSNGIGAEALFRGYQDRRRLWQRRHELRLPTAFYTSTLRPPVDLPDPQPYPHASKDPLFESMFSVVIENDYEDHYFTEKLIDSLRSYSVPLYLGARQVSRYFASQGVLTPGSVDELIEMANGLSPLDYWRRMPAMLENHRRSEPYWDLLAGMARYIEEGYRRLGPQP